ncbi:N-acetylglucosamine-6-phosphate deacetylase isoform X1 [Hydra vulgaris]|uniref:N-acetylglucosamine-6-phosphate deacetylase isoform X1 n=1 Tax=Hydra vulgaris TaxID=6087 RepID=UPI001F5E7966|nr:N-acetylglucosamine-6-phosphate deacetylase-like [Hydra vulgaris]
MSNISETSFCNLKNGSHLLVQFINCRILYQKEIIKEDFWVKNGKILNPEKIFFDEKLSADIQIDCKNMIIAPGYIDTQLNGGFGYDFSSNIESLEDGLNIVSKGILKHGVTSFCPTLVTSPANIYRQALPILMKRKGSRNGAEVLGAHCEGPFINIEKRGAHDPNYIKSDANGGIQVLELTYGSLDNIAIITVAPELSGIVDCIPSLVERNIVVSIGHSTASLGQSEVAVSQGASFITHLFNAMLPFHHRDPGMVGLLTSDVTKKTVFYGMITDGIHTHPTALRIAYRSHPKGIVITTDAIAALGLSPGIYKLGTMSVEISEKDAKIAGTNTLAGSVCSMDRCVYQFKQQTNCSLVEAIEAATLHPAQLLGISDRKGTLDFDTDADFIFLDDQLNVHATFIAGDLVWNSEQMSHLSKIYN